MSTPIGSWKVIWFGSAGPFYYDDGADALDPDLLYDGAAAPPQSAFITDGQLDVATAPVLDVNVLRLVDVGTLVGDVIGPAASTDHAVVRWDGVTGKLIQNSALILDDLGNLSKAVADLLLDCGINKTLELTQVVYDDLYFELAPKTTGAGKPTIVNFSGNINQWQMAINDISELHPVEAKHNGKEGTQIEVHVHWGTNGVDGTNRGVKWEIDFSWANISSTFAAASTISNETQIPANTPNKTHMYTSVTSFTPTGWTIGAGLLMSLKRINSVTDPAPASDPWVFMVGVHYQINTIGSRQRLIK